MARVEFNNISKRFNENVIALNNLNLTVQDGEFVVLVGPSGCGKSTALRLLAGLESVDEGNILIDGRIVNPDSPQQRNIAMVFQNYALYPHMSVRDNLAFPLRMAHASRSEITDKVEQIAGLLNLSTLLERKPKQLSGGQRQRVAMGRSLVRNPSVLLLDEPLSNLDAELRSRIRADIARLQRRLQLTTLYVTHDQVEAMTLGDRVAVMNAGELQQVGSPEMLYQAPDNIFVARFIGNPGMNVISAQVRCSADDELEIVIGNQCIALSPDLQQVVQGLSLANHPSVYVGIRPECLRITRQENDIGFRISPVSSEFLGHETLLNFRLPGVADAADTLFVARLPGRLDHAANPIQELFTVPDSLYVFTSEGHSIHYPARHYV